ncbi:MAG: flagellar basal body rod protein FlgB [Humidesulfovibrio sp.]|jgi:flagellar basal-body rod protein FlgB|uniref:flagellar basal body rod protein FlgB n=1 Tax=Humidesulfovibrio sp. TaxID=2910988 RepID=UPI0027EFD5A0|nr:flagellar basal body rod protein FlgB [Humidesulfovibrio sp.]MDQ7836848.1 flagellar basal body rod protein FlgB [Humidesulfovibrio sp.]
MERLFGNHIQVMDKVLDLRLQRQNVVMSNIANVTTRNYKPRSLAFEEDLQSALNLDARGKMTRTDESHLPSEFDINGFQGKGLTEYKPRVVYGEDVVDLDKEMAAMAKNTLMYNAITDIIAKQFSGIQTTIQDGSR